MACIAKALASFGASALWWLGAVELQLSPLLSKCFAWSRNVSLPFMHSAETRAQLLGKFGVRLRSIHLMPLIAKAD